MNCFLKIVALLSIIFSPPVFSYTSDLLHISPAVGQDSEYIFITLAILIISMFCVLMGAVSFKLNAYRLSSVMFAGAGLTTIVNAMICFIWFGGLLVVFPYAIAIALSVFLFYESISCFVDQTTMGDCAKDPQQDIWIDRCTLAFMAVMAINPIIILL